MLVVRVGAPYVGDGVVGTETYQRVDVGVGVVTGHVTVVKPEDALGMELAQKAFLDVSHAETGVAVGIEQTLCRGEDGTSAIALNGTSFEDEVVAVLIVGMPYAALENAGCDGIVLFVGKLVAPGVETKVFHGPYTAFEHTQGAVVAGPSVVGVATDKDDIGHQTFGQVLVQKRLYAVGFGRDDEQRFLRCHVECHLQIACLHLAEHGCPVGHGMWPREHHATLRIPLGRPHVGGLFDTGRLQFFAGDGACGLGDGG